MGMLKKDQKGEGLHFVANLPNGLTRVSVECENDTWGYLGGRALCDDTVIDGKQLLAEAEGLYWVMQEGKEKALADIGLAYYSDHPHAPAGSWLYAIDAVPAPIDVWIEIVQEMINKFDDALIVLKKQVSNDVYDIRLVTSENTVWIRRFAKHIRDNFRRWIEEVSSFADERGDFDFCPNWEFDPCETYSILKSKEDVDRIVAERKVQEAEEEDREEERKEKHRNDLQNYFKEKARKFDERVSRK